MLRVKICGVTRETDLRTAVDAGADAVGFIVDVPVDTPREIDPERAAGLVAATPPFVTTVLVLMPESAGHAVELVKTVEPDVVQLHGTFDPGEIRFVRAETGAKVVPVVDTADESLALAYDEVADALLVDTPSGEGGGGTGRTHDWDATRDLSRELHSPVILAGGLTPDNVAAAVDAVDPYGVDVASGVESSDGVKDHGAVGEFVRAARRDVGVRP